MKILMISGARAEVSTGETIHTLEVAGGLAGAGARVTLLLRGKYRGPGRPGVHVVGLPVMKNKWLDGVLRPVLVCVAASFFTLRAGCDAVYVRDSIFEMPVVWLCKLLGQIVVLELNTVSPEDLRAKGRSRWKQAIAAWAQRKACFSATLVLPVTAGLAGWLAGQGVPAGKVTVVANGANPYLYRPAGRKNALARLGLDPVKQYLCFAGNLAAWQGGEIVVEAFDRLAGRYPDAILLIIGDGPERQALELLACSKGLAGRVLFTGRLPYHRVPVYLNACVAGIGGGWYGENLTLKRRFCFSGSSALKFFSYLACGLPVVVPDIADLSGIVRRTGCGLVAEPDRVENLADALTAVLEHPLVWAEAGRRGRRFVEREAAWEHRASRIIDLVKKARRRKGR
ncbi:glycosyltransferase family 4 protein [Pelotomaculum terephthalicicum JT]|uniref:glycosyltransferase family 4 protein n=1 Tax=Pelotomaculum TaxID=191373 RepID=UPI0009C59EDC|nr:MULTISPECIES: glycosyltransferase family 4 protein [Pelotomaculum]MCG9969041.1 glycosyltransferase family 4 protein [Pelotomaculum terephthalicicum JT]OPX92109.1 MAG: Alpha-D-kanosaminyltransferase [Pelotomaculum sp. PtaB.Bin117]OPY62881.1 MAG: Alpha-D-kanosaminyltransferase [Pelotomaculum sp. PtaU1.Bin065]